MKLQKSYKKYYKDILGSYDLNKLLKIVAEMVEC